MRAAVKLDREVGYGTSSRLLPLTGNAETVGTHVSFLFTDYTGFVYLCFFAGQRTGLFSP
jgi:hypothetical protein